MSQRNANYPVIVDTQGEKTDPADAAVLADTGVLANGGIYEALILATASAASKVLVQRRNAANDAVVGDVQGFSIPAGVSYGFTFRFEIEKNERIRVIQKGALTGTSTVNITAQKVA